MVILLTTAPLALYTKSRLIFCHTGQIRENYYHKLLTWLRDLATHIAKMGDLIESKFWIKHESPIMKDVIPICKMIIPPIPRSLRKAQVTSLRDQGCRRQVETLQQFQFLLQSNQIPHYPYGSPIVTPVKEDLCGSSSENTSLSSCDCRLSGGSLVSCNDDGRWVEGYSTAGVPWRCRELLPRHVETCLSPDVSLSHLSS